jgi:hypothetical protein
MLREIVPGLLLGLLAAAPALAETSAMRSTMVPPAGAEDVRV